MFSPGVLLAEVILLATVAGGWMLGKLIHRWVVRRSPQEETAGGELSRLSDTVGFVGGAAGILLGLLLVFAVQHYTDAQAATRDEAVKSSRLFYSMGPFDAAERTAARQSLICYMQSVVHDDWRATAVGDITGAENTTAWSKQVRTELSEFTVETDKTTSAFQVLDEQTLGVAELRQFRLLIAQPQIPLIVWFVIYLSSLVLAALLALHLADRKYLGRVSISAIYIILAVVVMALAVLDEPFDSTMGGMEPTAMQSTINTLTDSYPETIPANCPVLAASDFTVH
jgi:hypothetical protein